MSTDLTPAQQALLETELRIARQRVEQSLQGRIGGAGRVAHAEAVVETEADELDAHEADRELDQLRGEQLRGELRDIDAALQRIQSPGYGRCVDCGIDIPFARLQHQPQALRCIDCQNEAEAELR